MTPGSPHLNKHSQGYILHENHLDRTLPWANDRNKSREGSSTSKFIFFFPLKFLYILAGKDRRSFSAGPSSISSRQTWLGT